MSGGVDHPIANNVATNIGVSGEALQKLVAGFWELLIAVELPEDDREAIEADVGVGEDKVC